MCLTLHYVHQICHLIVSSKPSVGRLGIFHTLEMRKLKLERLREAQLASGEAQIPTKVRQIPPAQAHLVTNVLSCPGYVLGTSSMVLYERMVAFVFVLPFEFFSQ